LTEPPRPRMVDAIRGRCFRKEMCEMARLGLCRDCQFGADRPRGSHDVDPPRVCTIQHDMDVSDDDVGHSGPTRCNLTLAQQLDLEHRIEVMEMNRR
jgi:hypothetical protein